MMHEALIIWHWTTSKEFIVYIFSCIVIFSPFVVIFVQMDHDLNTCTSGGVELFGSHLVVVPRRVQQSAPMLEEYCFVPNLSDIPCKTNLTNYLNMCSVYSVQRLQTLCNNGSINFKLDSVKSFLN